ncbi:MAG TPA: FN3 associated domain-containing protein [Verrucomicrobiae bacterium]|nr:FN3 associated domain-containing protein [Verrucomicrobiae bacterium]
MKNNFFRWLGRGWRLTMLGCLVGCASLLGAASLQAAVTVTTLGGGSNLNKNPKYLGYSDGNTFSSALFHTPCGLAIDSTGNYLFVADRDNNAIRYLDLGAGQTWTFAVANTALVNQPVGVLVDAAYNVYVLNRGTGNNGSVVTFDNFGETVATNATGLINAGGLTMDNLGNIYVTVSGNTVIKITPDGVRTNVATIPMAGTSLQGIVFKHNGLLAACDAGRNGIYLINPTTGLVTTNAGFHGRGDFPTNGNNVASSSTAKFYQPTGITEAGDGTLIVTDYGNNRVKVVLASGVVTNLYGVASNFWTKSYYPGWSDGTPKLPDATANNVQSRIPFGVAFAPDGSVYTSEDYYHLIRKTTGAGFVQPPPTPPAAPVITSVLTNYGTVTLNWSASATATSYNVKRSTSLGGPFTTLANTSATTYTDTSVVNGTTYYYVVSGLNAGGEGPNSAVVLAQPPYPPVTDPQIGYVTFTPITDVSVFHPVSSFDFFNVVPFVIKGTPGSGTYYTYGFTTNAATVQDPTPSDASVPSDYADGLSELQVPLYQVSQVAPFLTIKAMAAQGGRPNSAVVMSVVQFKTGNPNITGNNAAQFTISDITANAHLYYTLDGSDPSSTNASSVDLGTVGAATNVWTVSLGIQATTVFKVRAFRDNFQPSAIITNQFSITNYVANTVSFGFASGEASSDFVGAPGQTFYAPVTLTTLPNTKIYSLQFGITVTNGGIATNAGPAVAANEFVFQSMLMKPDPKNPGYITAIPPAMFVNYTINTVTVTNFGVPITITNYVPNFTNLETYVTSAGLLTVGWLERFTKTNLYPTTLQTLITYSQAHDDIFPTALQPNGAILGGYAFHIPPNATLGQQYQIQISRPSATDDGVGAPGSSVYIAAPTNGAPAGGSVNAVKVVTAGQRKYIAGSVYPFRWFNAGDFGSSNIVSADVEQVFQSAIYSLNYPPAGSDFFDAMDSCGFYYVDNGNGYLENSFIPADTSFLFDGNDTTINQIAFGDGTLDVCDVFVTYRRSLDSSLTWFRRYWNNGQLVADTAPNQFYAKTVSASVKSKTVSAAASGSSKVNFAAGDIQGSAGQVVQIPITATICGDYPLRLLMLNLTVDPLDGSPALTTPVQFNQTAPIGAPYTTDSKGNGNYSAVWLNITNAGVTGTVTLGTLLVTIPAGAPATAAYAVHFDHASASPNGLATFPKQTLTGLITLASRTNSTYGDGIPDSWRLRWFGSIYNYLSLSNACASGDGVNNFKKYVAGVDPNVANNFPSVNAKTPVPAGFTTAIHWPSVSGKKYAIERSATLFPGNWSAITTNTGTGTDMEFDDNVAGSSQFYRVRILP